MKSGITAVFALVALSGVATAFQDPPVCNCTDNGASWVSNPGCPDGISRAVTDNLTCVGTTGHCTLSGSVTVTWADGCDQCMWLKTAEGGVGMGPSPASGTSPSTLNVSPSYSLTCANNVSVAWVDFYDNVLSAGACTGNKTATWQHVYHCH